MMVSLKKKRLAVMVHLDLIVYLPDEKKKSDILYLQWVFTGTFFAGSYAHLYTAPSSSPDHFPCCQLPGPLTPNQCGGQTLCCWNRGGERDGAG